MTFRFCKYFRRAGAELVAIAVLLSAALPSLAIGQDLSNTRNFLFVADAVEPLIDVFDLSRQAVVARIDIPYRADHVLVAPDAPLLVFANIDRRSVSFFNTGTQEIVNTVDVPIAPLHMVMDGTGRRIGVTNSESGGLVLLSTYRLGIDFVVEDFPATADVLFDANDVDIYFSDAVTGALGVLDMNVQRYFHTDVLNEPGDMMSPPSRSLDGRYVYVADQTSGEVYGINAFSKAIYRAFSHGGLPARPYTSPEGLFLYLSDQNSGRISMYDQQRFEEWAEIELPGGSNLVAVGRFDRLSLFLSSSHRRYTIYDNIQKRVIGEGEFPGTPIDAQGSADGRRVYVAFSDAPELAIVELERQELDIVAVTDNGASDFALGQTNNVCH